MQTPAYDLGDLDVLESRSAPAARGKAEDEVPRVRPGSDARTPSAGGPSRALAASLSLFVPGLGQLALGRGAAALGYLSILGFFGALAWAVLTTIDRATPTLAALAWPRETPLLVLAAVFIFSALAHVGSVLDAAGPDRDRAPHPLVAGLAAGLVPGWGQILNGHPRRAALFLVATWGLGAIGAARSAAVEPVLRAAEWSLPGPLSAAAPAGPILAAFAVVWALAVYDAAASAVAARR